MSERIRDVFIKQTKEKEKNEERRKGFKHNKKERKHTKSNDRKKKIKMRETEIPG